MRLRDTRLLSAALVVALILAAGAATAQMQLENSVVGAGGGEAASISYGVRLTVGQPVTGTAASTGTRALFGVWYRRWVAAVSAVPGEPVGLRNHLHQNAPNPFNPRTTIHFSIEKTAPTRLEVYDLRGHRVALLLDRTVAAGDHTLVFQPENLASGVYLLRLRAGSFDAVRRLVLLK